MYDELVSGLRYCAGRYGEFYQCGLCPLYEQCYTRERTMEEAADAIEELQQTAEHYHGCMNDWFEAAQEYEAAVPKWIPMTEAMPESGVCVLVTDGLEVGEGWLTEITNTRGHFMRWCVPMTDIDVDRRPITHWMPMPKAPRDGE